MSGSPYDDVGALYEKRSMATAISRCYERFIAYLSQLIEVPQASAMAPIQYALGRKRTFLFVKQHTFDLTPKQHAFMVTLLKMLAANGNSPVSATAIERELQRNQRLFPGATDGEPRFKEFMKTKARWVQIIQVLKPKARKGKQYRIKQKLMTPPPQRKMIN